MVRNTDTHTHTIIHNGFLSVSVYQTPWQGYSKIHMPKLPWSGTEPRTVWLRSQLLYTTTPSEDRKKSLQFYDECLTAMKTMPLQGMQWQQANSKRQVLGKVPKEVGKMVRRERKATRTKNGKKWDEAKGKATMLIIPGPSCLVFMGGGGWC